MSRAPTGQAERMYGQDVGANLVFALPHSPLSNPTNTSQGKGPPPMFKFAEGAHVAIKNDDLVLGLTAGETGKIWALYDTQPPAYEVTFRSQGGDEFDALMYEEELVPLPVERELASQGTGHSLASV